MVEPDSIPQIAAAFNNGEYLLADDRCILCPKPIGRATADHIFPRSICKAHLLILGSLLDSDYNFAPLCRLHHDRVDFSASKKFAIINNFEANKLFRLTEWIMDKYPRANDLGRRIVQEAQWLRLIARLNKNISEIQGEKPYEYWLIEDLIETYFFKWQLQGLTRINFLGTNN